MPRQYQADLISSEAASYFLDRDVFGSGVKDTLSALLE